MSTSWMSMNNAVGHLGGDRFSHFRRTHPGATWELVQEFSLPDVRGHDDKTLEVMAAARRWATANIDEPGY